MSIDAAESKIKVVCLMGPTASGKTDAACFLAEKLNGEVISVDSALIYRGMDIGTAKPSLAEREAVKHYLIDIREPYEHYSAADFVTDATACIEDIHSRGKLPILAGGTMLYFHALQQGLSSLPERDPELRKQLQQRIDSEGLSALHEELLRLDPVAAARIHPNDPQRVLRALEVCHLTGDTLTSLQNQTKLNPRLKFISIALCPADRALLHQRIETRFDTMLARGFLDEAKQFFYDKRIPADSPAMRSVGYRQAWQYFAGELDKVMMREKAIIATRQLAKRQMTWLRSWPDCQIIDSYANGYTKTLDDLTASAIDIAC